MGLQYKNIFCIPEQACSWVIFETIQFILLDEHMDGAIAFHSFQLAGSSSNIYMIILKPDEAF